MIKRWLYNNVFDDVEIRYIYLFGRPIAYDHITFKVSFEKNMLISVMLTSALCIPFVLRLERPPLFVALFGILVVAAIAQYLRRSRQGWRR